MRTGWFNLIVSSGCFLALFVSGCSTKPQTGEVARLNVWGMPEERTVEVVLLENRTCRSEVFDPQKLMRKTSRQVVELSAEEFAAATEAANQAVRNCGLKPPKKVMDGTRARIVVMNSGRAEECSLLGFPSFSKAPDEWRKFVEVLNSRLEEQTQIW
jgi:hypothetical protein